MPDFVSFNKNLGGIASALAGRAREEQLRRQAFADAIAKVQIEGAIKQRIQQAAAQNNLKTLQTLFPGLVQQNTQPQGQQQAPLSSTAQPAMSLISGQQGDIQGNVINQGVEGVNFNSVLNTNQIQPEYVASPSVSFNPVTGEMQINVSQKENPKYKAQQEIEQQKEKTRATKITEMNLKREVFKKDLGNFLQVDDLIERGKGLARIKRGIKTKFSGFTQDSPQGRAAATHKAARKRLRVQLVRAAGDVGNINIVEQKAAEQMIPTEFDDVGTSQLKRAYLQEIGRAIDNNDGNAVKDVINSFMQEGLYQVDGENGDNSQLNSLKQKYGLD